MANHLHSAGVDQADALATDGAVHLRGLFTDWIDELAAGVARNEAQPS